MLNENIQGKIENRKAAGGKPMPAAGIMADHARPKGDGGNAATGEPGKTKAAQPMASPLLDDAPIPHAKQI